MRAKRQGHCHTAEDTTQDDKWEVPLQTGKGKYTVDIDGEIPHCTCPLAHCSNALRISGISCSLVDQLTKAARMAGFPGKKGGGSKTHPSSLSASREGSRCAACAARMAQHNTFRRNGPNTSNSRHHPL